MYNKYTDTLIFTYKMLVLTSLTVTIKERTMLQYLYKPPVYIYFNVVTGIFVYNNVNYMKFTLV